YILDLQPENSFVAHAVASGHTVFLVSWRNVRADQGRLTWDDYLELGVFTPLRLAREIAQSDKVNALGFCVGGTLLGAALAVLAHRKDDLVASVTFLTTMLDFSETGQIGLFVDEAMVAARGPRFRLLQPARERSRLAVRRQQLSPGRDAGGVRHPSLERRQHQPAGADVLLLPAQHVSFEQAARAQGAHQLRRAGRPRRGRAAALRPRHARGPHRALAIRLPDAAFVGRNGQAVHPRR